MIGAEQGNVENFESLDRWKWHIQSLLYLFGIMICESILLICDYRNENSRHGI
jgi:hypothetical protein